MALILLQLTTKTLAGIEPETLFSICNLDRGPHTLDLHFLSRNDPKHPKAIRSHQQGYNMEMSRQWAVKHEYDYILVVQSDIIFPPETLLVLIEKMKEHKAGVICPLTPERPEKVGTDDFVVCMHWNGNPHARKNINLGKDFEVTGNGSGYMCVLVRRDVFEKIPFPVRGSSDINWYKALRKAGVKILCHVGLRLGHKQRSDDLIIRGDIHIVQHWKAKLKNNSQRKKPWFYGLPGKWWWGRSADQFLSQLPEHIDGDRRWWSW